MVARSQSVYAHAAQFVDLRHICCTCRGRGRMIALVTVEKRLWFRICAFLPAKDVKSSGQGCERQPWYRLSIRWEVGVRHPDDDRWQFSVLRCLTASPAHHGERRGHRRTFGWGRGRRFCCSYGPTGSFICSFMSDVLLSIYITIHV